jgi:hypothetical protein
MPPLRAIAGVPGPAPQRLRQLIDALITSNRRRAKAYADQRNELTLTLKLLRKFGSCASTSWSQIPQP